MKAQLRFADGEGFAQAVIIGEDEINNGVVTLRNMETSEQVEVGREELAARLSSTAPRAD